MVQIINTHPAPGCNRSPPYYVFSKDAILGSVPSISSEVLGQSDRIFPLKNYFCFLLFQQSKKTYRVTQQCCPGGNRPETPGLRIFWAKSLVIPAIYTNFKLMAHKFKLEFCINGWNYQWFSPKNPETLRRGSPGGLRMISAGTTLLGHTVDSCVTSCPLIQKGFNWIQ